MPEQNFTELECEISPLIPGRDVMIGLLAELEFDSFVETASGIKAYIPSDRFNKEEVEAIVSNPPSGFSWTIHVNEIPAENWNARWEADFEPVRVEKLLRIKAPFHEEDDSFELEVTVSPKMAFGTGHHATTWLVAKDMMSYSWQHKDVLDMGCGTGVLAIVAKKRGSGRTLAIDIDPWSTENTEENKILNNTPDIEVRLGDASAIGNEHFDCILANINRNILVRDMPVYAAALKPNGRIWFSGFFTMEAELIIEAGRASGLTFEHSDSREEWAMVRMKK